MGKPRKTAAAEPLHDAPPPAPPSAMRRLARRVLKAVFRPERLAMLALLPVVGVIAPIVWRHWPNLDESPTYRLKASDVRITPPPASVPRNLVERAVGTAGLTKDVSILNRDLLPALAAAFAAEPWVKRVVRLQKGLPAHVAVELEYRVPVAVVEVRNGVYPIDEEGVLLPPQDVTPAAARRLPLVTGVVSDPAGPAGKAWGDPVVSGAAKIAAAVGPYWDGLGVTSIVAPPPAAEANALQYELAAVGGTRIVWGPPPGTGQAGELTAEQKVGRLRRYVADFGRLDAGQAFEIDIRPWQEITRRPLATAGRTPPRR